MNPFGLSGDQAVGATLVVCLTVGVCVCVWARATVKVVERICAAVERAWTALVAITTKK